MKYIKTIAIYSLAYIIAAFVVVFSDELDKSYLTDIAIGIMVLYLLLENFKNER